jgi:hypothetical protein
MMEAALVHCAASEEFEEQPGLDVIPLRARDPHRRLVWLLRALTTLIEATLTCGKSGY